MEVPLGEQQLSFLILHKSNPMLFVIKIEAKDTSSKLILSTNFRQLLFNYKISLRSQITSKN